MAAALRLPESLRDTVHAFARHGYPHETCGLLLGTRDGGENRVTLVRQARNVNSARARDRYEVDPNDFLAADREAFERLYHLRRAAYQQAHIRVDAGRQGVDALVEQLMELLAH